jgi:1-acyl-sn-glycerol-3-phosphate acyltransferase
MMLHFLFNWFVKITGFIPALILMPFKTHYFGKKAQSRRIKGKAIVVSNHHSIWDFGLMIFLFWTRTLRCVVGEIMYQKSSLMTLFLRAIGGIKVERYSHDFTFIGKCKKILDKGGVVEIYPEAKINSSGDGGLLEFKPSVVYLALESGAPVIPVYNAVNYFSFKRGDVVIGEPINFRELYDDNLSEKDNITNMTDILRNKVLELKNELEEKRK